MKHTKITVTGQGDLVTVKLHTPLTKRKHWGNAVRNIITSFSRKSRLNFMRFMARLAYTPTVFITLTYGQSFPPPATAKLHLREMCRRLSRINPAAAFIWRQELQTRGAIHFHILMTKTTFIPKELIAMLWASVVGYEYCDFTEHKQNRSGPPRPPFTRIEKVRSKRKLQNYVSKYMAKVPTNASGFNDVPYLHTETGEVLSVGRQWGIYTRSNLIFAVIVTITLPHGDWYRHMTCAMGHVWSYCHRAIFRDTGFSLFYDKALIWVERARNYFLLYSFDECEATASEIPF